MGAASASGLATVQRFYELMGQDKFEEASQLLADDIVLRETPDLPFGGDYHGHEGNARLIGLMTSVFDLSIAKIDFLDAGEAIVAKIHACFTVKASGIPLDLDIIEIIKVRDNKIADVDIYHKTPSVLAAHWPK